jgi:hypothetical protein
MVRLGIHRKGWPEFLCLGGYLTPPRQVGGFAPRDALGRHPSADPRGWRPAGGGPVAGAQSAKVVVNPCTCLTPFCHVSQKDSLLCGNHMACTGCNNGPFFLALSLGVVGRDNNVSTSAP